MALAFLSLFGLAVAAVLTFAETGFRTADSVHKTTERQYAADAAIDATINSIRRSTAIGKAPFNADCFSLPPGEVNATAVTVRCTSRANSGATATLPGGGAFPSDAVLTLPPTTAEGVTVGSGASPVVSGNVTTRQRVTVPSGSSLSVLGTLSCASTTGGGTLPPRPAPVPEHPTPSTRGTPCRSPQHRCASLHPPPARPARW